VRNVFTLNLGDISLSFEASNCLWLLTYRQYFLHCVYCYNLRNLEEAQQIFRNVRNKPHGCSVSWVNIIIRWPLQPPSGPRHPYHRVLTYALVRVTVSRTPLDEWSARRRDLYLTTQNTHKRQTSKSPGFGPANPPESDRRYTLQTARPLASAAKLLLILKSEIILDSRIYFIRNGRTDYNHIYISW